jgi:hypothetical protein
LLFFGEFSPPPAKDRLTPISLGLGVGFVVRSGAEWIRLGEGRSGDAIGLGRSGMSVTAILDDDLHIAFMELLSGEAS